MTAKVILNPYAGRWKAKERKDEVIAVLNTIGLEFEFIETTSPGHGKLLAANAVKEGFDPIIAAGGDGSVNEVINGMMSTCGNGCYDNLPRLGVLPLGSANDLVVNLGLPVELTSAAKVIADGFSRKMDLGIVNSHYFDNNSALGIEPTITLIQQRITRLRGTLRYVLATLIGVMQNPSWVMQIEWDKGSYEGPITIVTVGNNPITGGVFYVTPHADPFDGLLTFVYGYLETRLQLLRMLPRIMKSGEGNYIEHPDIHEIHTKWLNVRSESPTPMHADGEIQSEALQEIEYKVFPECICILLKEEM